MSLTEQLFSLKDESYRLFLKKLIPNLYPETIIGVRTPSLRLIAGKLENRERFLSSLPHRYFEENQIHTFLLEKEKSFETAITQVEAFLPYIDNWATCDQFRPKVFRKHRSELLPYIHQWLTSDHPYTIRFGISMLMRHFLDDDFHSDYLHLVASVTHEDYYVRMMVAWYFATALAKQYGSSLPYIAEHRLPPWTHKKTIQKAVESYRLSTQQKDELKRYRT